MNRLSSLLAAACTVLAACFVLSSCVKGGDDAGDTLLELSLEDAAPVDFTVKVKAGKDAGLYYIGVGTKADYDRLGSAGAFAAAFVEMENERGDVDWGHADGMLVHEGSKSVSAGELWNLRPKTEYAVTVFGVGPGGEIRGEPLCDFVKTTAVEPSDNVISLEVDPQTGVVSAEVTRQDETYFLDVVEASRIEGYPEDGLAEFIIGSYGGNIVYCLETGDVTRDFSKILEDDTEYCALAFGYLGGYATTSVVKVPFRTSDGGVVPEDCTFTFEVSDVTSASARVRVVPSDLETTYLTNVHNKALVDSYLEGAGLGQLVADELEMIAEALSEQYGIEITPEKAAEMVAVVGEDVYVYTSLSVDTEYYVFAAGIDRKGRLTTEVFLSDVFRTAGVETGPSEPMACEIDVEGVSEEGLVVNVVPEDKEMTYVGMAGEGDYYLEFASDEEYLADDVALWTEMAAGEQMSLVELLQAFGLFLKGDATYVFPESFGPGTLYLAYVYGMDLDGKLTSGMAKAFFTVAEDGSAVPADPYAGAAYGLRDKIRIEKQK